MKLAFVSTVFERVPSTYQGSRAAEEPLDLLYAMAEARARGHQCELVDIWSDAADAWLAAADGIVASTTNSYLQWNNHPLGLDLFASTWAAIQRRTAGRRPPTVVFGPHVAAHRPELLALGVDAALLGEAELAVIDAIERLAAGATLDEAPSPAVVGELDRLPTPAWDLVLARPYNAHNRTRAPALGHLYEGSRGCPFQCSYCNTITHRRSFRTKRPETIERDLARLAAITDRDYVYFIDESFACRDRWIRDLAPRLAALPFSYGCQGNLKFMSEWKLDLLREAGFESIEFGWETGDVDVLEGIGKDNHPVARQIELINHAAAIGLNPLLFVLVGLPGESRGSQRNTVELLGQLAPAVRASISIPTPYQGTRLYQLGRSEGRIGDERGAALYAHSGRIGHRLQLQGGRRDAFLGRFGPNHHVTASYVQELDASLRDLFHDHA